MQSCAATAAPEPLASRGHFYDDERLLALAAEAGLQDAGVRNERGGQLLSGAIWAPSPSL